MERLLTPLLNRFLSKFVKSSQEGEYGLFKASLSGGGVQLHNLELDLDALLPSGVVASQRAFARSLQVKIPWTSLNTQPIEVVLDTVEIILVPGSPQEFSLLELDKGPETPTDSDLSGASGWLGGGSSWLGSGIQALALRAGLNVSVTIKNLLAKYIHPDGYVITVALEKLDLATCSSEEWKDLVQNPEAWLSKQCTVKGLSVGINPANLSHQGYLPVLRLNSVTISALLPIFAFIEGLDLGSDAPKVTIEVHLSRLTGAVNDAQLAWTNALLQSFKMAKTSSIDIALQEEHAVSSEPLASAPPEIHTAAMEQQLEEEGSLHRPQMKALGIFGKIWDLVVDEATYIQGLEEEEDGEDEENGGENDLKPSDGAIAGEGEASRAAPIFLPDALHFQGIPMHAELSAQLDDLSIQFGTISTSVLRPVLEIELGVTRALTASTDARMQAVQIEMQHLSVKHNAASQASADKAAWDEVLGIHPWPLEEVSEEEEEDAVCSAAMFRWRGDEDALCSMPLATEGGGVECSLRVGQIWAGYRSAILEDINAYIMKPLSSLLPPPATSLPADNSSTLASSEEEDLRQQWWQVSGLNIELALVQLAFIGPESISKEGYAAFVLQSDGIMYAANPGSTSVTIGGLQTSVALALVQGPWEVYPSRAGLASVPGAVQFGDTVTLKGDGTGSTSLSISPFTIELTGTQVDAVRACLAGGSSAESTNFSLLGPPGRVWIALHDGMQLEYCHNLSSADQNERRQLLLSSKRVAAGIACELSQEGTVTAQMECINASYSAMPGYCASVSLASLHLSRMTGENTENEPLHSVAVPPLLLASQLSFTGKEQGSRELVFGSVNIHAGPDTLEDVVAVVNQMHPSPDPATAVQPAVLPDADASSVTTSVSINMATITVLPPSSAQLPDSIKEQFGLTLWLANLNLTTSTALQNISLESIEALLCRGMMEEGKRELKESGAATRVFRSHPTTPGEGTDDGSQSVLFLKSTFNSQLNQRQFTVQLKPVEITISPCLLSTLHDLQSVFPAMTNPPPPLPPPPLVHGTIACEGALVTVVTDLPHGVIDNDISAEIGVTISIEHAFVLIHQDPAWERRPWLVGSGAASTRVEASLMGLAVQVLHKGIGAAGSTEILLPTDLSLALHHWGPGNSTILSLDTKALHTRVSAPVLQALSRVGSAFSKGGGDHLRQDGGCDAQEEEPLLGAALMDDLRSGIFYNVGSDQLLRPLGVVLGSSGAEIGEGSIAWHYPWRRPVSCLFFENIDEGFLGLPLCLSWLDEESGDFIPVSTRLTQIPDSSHACMVVSSAVSATIWKLSWSNNAQRHNAIELCRQLFINPQGLGSAASLPDKDGLLQAHPPPLPAKFTANVTIADLTATLLAAGECAGAARAVKQAHVLDTLAELSAQEVGVTTRTWSSDEGVFTVDTTFIAQLNYVESATMCSMPLIDEFTAKVCYAIGGKEKPSLGSDSVDSRNADNLSSFSVLDERSWEEDCGEPGALIRSSVRRRPAPGTSVEWIFETPLVVNLKELTPHDLHRLWALAWDLEAPIPAPIKITNSTNLDLWIGQCGTSAHEPLPGGMAIDYHWHAPPSLRPGARLALQLALPPSNKAQAVTWTPPLEAMAVGGTPAILTKSTAGGPQSYTVVAVQVTDQRGVWHVDIRPGMRVFNHHQHAINVLLSETETDKAQASVCIPIAAGAVLDVPCDGRSLRFWLGEDKWTREIAARSHPKGTEVLEGDANFAWSGDVTSIAAGHQYGAPMLAHFAGQDASTGHTILAMWPAITLTNMLPYAIVLCPPAHALWPPVCLEPGSLASVPADIAGGEVMRLRVGGNSGDLAATSPSLPVFCPPLGDDSNSTPCEMESSGVAYIMAPGSAAEMDVPWAAGKDDWLPCILATEPMECGPGLQLRLLPQSVFVNMLPCPVNLRVPGLAEVEVGAHTSIAVDLRQATSQNAQIYTSIEGVKYDSQPFALTPDQETMLSLYSKKAGSGLPTSNLRIAVKIDAWSAAASSSLCLQITFAQALYVTNATDYDLAYRTHSSASANDAKVILAKSFAPVIISSSAGGEHGLEFAIADASETLFWSPCIDVPSNSLDRGRFSIQHDARTIMLSYSAACRQGYTHLIVFRDRQPPASLFNRTMKVIEVEWTMPSGNRESATVQPGEALDFDIAVGPMSLHEEDSFLPQHPSMDANERQTLRLRESGRHWSQIPLAIDGNYSAEDLYISIEQQGCTLRVIVAEKDFQLPRPPIRLTIAAPGMRISAWTDERCRLGEQTVADQEVLRFETQEVFLTHCDMSLNAFKRNVNTRLCIQSVECSAHFPSHLSLLTAASDEDTTLVLKLQAGYFEEDGLALPSCWVESASFVVPPLAVHIDDDVFELLAKLKGVFDIPVGYSVDMSQTPDEWPAMLKEQAEHAVEDRLSPVSVSGIGCRFGFVRLSAMTERIIGHAMSEALLSAPLVLGSLQLFFNPTGLVRSIQRGVSDMIELPLQGLQRGSALEFFTGIGHGSASLVKEISGWSISSVVGFSRAASNALSGSRMVSTLRTSRSSEELGHSRISDRTNMTTVSSSARLAACLNTCPEAGSIICVTPVQEVTVWQDVQDSEPRAFRLSCPVILLTTSTLVLYSEAGLTPSFITWLDEASLSHDASEGNIEIKSPRAAPLNALASIWRATVHLKISLQSLPGLLPCLRRTIAKC